MSGTARENAAALRERLDARRGDPAVSSLPDELFAAADLVGAEQQLRSALSDAGQPADSRGGLARSLFESRLSPLAVDVLVDVASQRWSSPTALVEAIEDLAAQAAFLVAEREGTLDRLEDQLFGFSQTVAGSADLQMALTDPAVGPRAKRALVDSLLAGRVTPQASQVLGYALSHLRGRRADSVLEDLMDAAAAQRGRSVAEVRVARPLDDEQAARLEAALSRLQGRPIRLNVAVDPEVLGGIAVRVGSQVIDGTVATRIEQARRALVG